MRKISLVRLLFRPVSTIRDIWRVCKHIEIHFSVKAKEDPKAAFPQDGYVSIDTFHVVIPASTFLLLKPAMFPVDYKYINGTKTWFIKKDKSISHTVFSKDEMTALHVAERLDTANGN